MNYSANKKVTPTMFNTKHVSEQESDTMSFQTITRQYSSFVFLVSMKYLKDEEKSKNVVIQVFKNLFEILQQNHILNVKTCLYNETKNHCLRHLK